MKRIPIEVRRQIENLLKTGHRPSRVAKLLNLALSTVCRELKKCTGFYNADEADKNTSHGMHPIDFDIIGKRFGLLIVKSYVNKIHKHRTYWKCRCDCGREVIISRKILVEYCSPDRQLSCGCIAKEHKGNGEKVPFEEASLRKFQDLMNFRKIEDNHWIWTGYCQKSKGKQIGTPKTSWKNKTMTVRKCIWLLYHGLEDEPKSVYLTCDNPLCFNPEHLTIERPKIRRIYNKDNRFIRK